MAGVDDEGRRLARDGLGHERSGQAHGHAARAGHPSPGRGRRRGRRPGRTRSRRPLGPLARRRGRPQDEARGRAERFRAWSRGGRPRIALDLHRPAARGHWPGSSARSARDPGPGRRTARSGRRAPCRRRGPSHSRSPGPWLARASRRTCALRTAARASSSRPGSRDLLRKAGAGSPAIAAWRGTADSASRSGLLVGRVAGPVGEPLADPDHQLGEVDALVAELGLARQVLEHLARRVEGRRPGAAGDRDVLADVGQRPQHARLAGPADPRDSCSRKESKSRIAVR